MADEQEVDPGEPVRELAAFEDDVSATLPGRVRSAIHRRTSAAQFTSFIFYLPFVVLKEFWFMLAGQFTVNRAEGEGRK
jgi:hypothetical protein